MQRNDQGNKVTVRLNENTKLYNGRRTLYGIVTRNTLSMDTLIARAVKRHPGLSSATLAAAWELLVDEIGDAISCGNSVKLPSIGTLRVAVAGSIPYSEHPAPSDIPGFTVRFTPAKALKARAQALVVDLVKVNDGRPAVHSAEDKLTKSHSVWGLSDLVELRGQRLNLSDKGGGVYFAPKASGGTIDSDEAKWYKLPSHYIVQKTRTTLQFIVPRELPSSTDYSVVLRRGLATRYEEKRLFQEVLPDIRVV